MKRSLHLSLSVIVLSAAFPAPAQDDPKLFVPYKQQSTTGARSATPVMPVLSEDSGRITIHESARIKALMNDYAGTRQPLKGYRVQIFLGDRTKAEGIRRTFLVKHPDTPAYLDYLAPNFRVRVGDQRTKLDGEILKQALQNEYPGLYVVPCEIEMPRLPEDGD